MNKIKTGIKCDGPNKTINNLIDVFPNKSHLPIIFKFFPRVFLHSLMIVQKSKSNITLLAPI